MHQMPNCGDAMFLSRDGQQPADTIVILTTLHHVFPGASSRWRFLHIFRLTLPMSWLRLRFFRPFAAGLTGKQSLRCEHLD